MIEQVFSKRNFRSRKSFSTLVCKNCTLARLSVFFGEVEKNAQKQLIQVVQNIVYTEKKEAVKDEKSPTREPRDVDFSIQELATPVISH